MGYYNDIMAPITEEFAPQVGLINRALIVTHEAAIPFLKLSGQNAKTELQDWLTTNTETAPLLLKAVELATTQADTSGNAIIPDYVYVCGAIVATWETATDVSALTNLIEANTTVESDFWGIIPVDYNAKFMEWAVGFCNSKAKGLFIDIEAKKFIMDDLKKSSRIYAIYNSKAGEQLNQQFAPAVYGRVFGGTDLKGTKFKTLAGCTGYTSATLTDSEVSTLATNGVNTYLKRYGRSTLDGSFTTDSDGTQKVTNHIDEMYVRDNIKYNLVKNIYYWLNETELASMSDYAELEAVVNTVLNSFADMGFIATENGIKQFIVDVPVPTSQDRAERLMKGTFKYLPNAAIEWVTITGEEVLKVIGGEE